MSKDAVLTLKLEAELRDQFMAEAEAAHRPASQIVRELIRGYIDDQRQARQYQEFLAGKVHDARSSLHRGEGIDQEDVEAEFSRRRSAAQ